MATFAENEVEILRIYELSSSLRQRVKNSLDEGPDVPTHIRGDNPRPLTENAKAVARKRARGAVRVLLAGFDQVHQAGDRPAAIDQAYDALLTRQFRLAKGKIEGIATASIPMMGAFARATILSATARDDLPFTAVKTDIVQGKPIEFPVPAVFPGYRGPRLNAEARDVLVDVALLLTDGSERQFRIAVVQAVAAAGEGDYQEAITIYGGLQAKESDLPEHKRKFIALQKAFAHLAHGDQQFRRLGPDARVEVVEHYHKARQTLEDAGISPENPLHQEILDYADQQELKLARNLNVLGYSQQFVPDRPFAFYFNQASTRIGLASVARDRFEEYLRKAFEREDVEKELQEQEATARDRVEQADLNERAAGERVRKMERNIERIEDSQLFHDISAAVEVIGAVAETVEATQGALAKKPPPGSMAGAISSGSGLLGTAVNFKARREELRHQKELAKIDRDIAELERASAAIDRRIAQRRLDFITDKLNDTIGRNLNKDLYYALARTFEHLTLEHLGVAIRSAFLAERRAAFELGTSDFPRRIKLEYLRTEESKDTPLHGLIAAPELLQADLTLLHEQFEDRKSVPVLFTEILSLRESFPIEFNAFRSTGAIEFAVSLYELDKHRPGTFNRRLLAVEVEILGLLPSLGFRGNLRHVGPFLLRELEPSLEAGRLLPTADEVADALNDLSAGKAATVGGVTWFNPGPEIKELSVMSLSEERQLLGKDPSARGIFEGYGPTGLWRLELPRESNPDLNYDNIVDVRIRFHVVSAERDEDLEDKVKELTAAYEEELSAGEALDRITVLSLRETSAAAFSGLQAGASDLRIGDDNFPGDPSARLKVLLLQAVADDGTGVGDTPLVVTKADAPFVLERVTGADGFTEDINEELAVLEPGERFPVEGVWTFALGDPSAFDRLSDLRLFFVHELVDT